MKLYDPGTLKTFLGKHGVRAEKGLGQHFLCSKSAVEDITSAVRFCKGILEIGPGPGVLTSELSTHAEKTIALELDGRMIEALAESAPDADVRQIDALQADLEAILKDLPEPRAVVSNLPYYITGPLLTRIAEARDHYAVAVLMMQKEVAMRVVAKEKTSDRGSLSVYLQSQFDIRLVAQVPAGCFMPPPKVDSTVLEFRPIAISVPADEVEAYFRLIRVGFTQPRKTLANNLVSGFSLQREQAIVAIEAAGLVENIRPQQLSNNEWVALHRQLVS